MSPKEMDAEHLKLYRALRSLESAATEVAKLGAQPGRQWANLNSALITARCAIDQARPLV